MLRVTLVQVCLNASKLRVRRVTTGVWGKGGLAQRVSVERITSFLDIAIWTIDYGLKLQVSNSPKLITTETGLRL